MRKIERQIEVIEQLDQFIRLGETGTPDQLAEKLEISKTSLFQIIIAMKQLNASIVFDIKLQSYVFEKSTNFRYGFYTRRLYGEEVLEVSSNGTQSIIASVDFKYPSLRIV
ncbi:hypothetical protein AWE51_09435 [Aquimarina aggregata]|uniref:Helix-turn-helix type 11 domain-containing protein n=1 Tax=Aquimarina aggregata TaxID=1642818 RepID=A0A162ZKF6_9FLAO|nr:hypothetical protein [Aquimarina aggregata]KZS39857.1 hypothetical protein AWE51_09435 [Aquimarina aggregata]